MCCNAGSTCVSLRDGAIAPEGSTEYYVPAGHYHRHVHFLLQPMHVLTANSAHSLEQHKNLDRLRVLWSRELLIKSCAC